MNISILGSTGSIGTQTLEVVDNLPYVKVIALGAGKNLKLLKNQVEKYKPALVCVSDEIAFKDFVPYLISKNIAYTQNLEEIAVYPTADIVVNALSGNVGLLPTVAAIKVKKNIALANKEVIVSAGQLIMELVREYGVNLYPLDSEHSAIQQCLEGSKNNKIRRLILTASGGPFRTWTKQQLESATIEEALKHPNWVMGKKITIDSATLMNKALEIIEARWIFDCSPHKIEVIIHPQSIIHSMVEYEDKQIIAQLGSHDMRLPIQYALTYPQRLPNNFPGLTFTDLTFEEVRHDLFPAINLAYFALKKGGTTPAVLNAANETAVDKFLKGEIKFTQITQSVKQAVEKHKPIYNYKLEDILEIDKTIRNEL